MRTPQAFSVWWLGLTAGCAAALVSPRAFAQPIARDDVFSTSQATPITIAPADGVLRNDSATAGGALDAVLVTNVTHGLLLFGADGFFYYLPNADFTGNDTFTYQAREAGTTLSNIATMLRPGGLFLSNQVVQPLPSIPMELLGHTDVPMELAAAPRGGHPSEPVGDRFFSYRRRESPPASGAGVVGGKNPGAGVENAEPR